MKEIIAQQLTDEQVIQISGLVQECNARENTGVTYPVDEVYEENLHFLLYTGDGLLIAVLGVFPYPDKTAECCAFTRPDYQKNGYFGHLLELAADHFEEYDLIFGITTHCMNALAVMTAIDAELISQDYQMKRSTAGLPPCDTDAVHSLSLRTSDQKTDAFVLQLYDGNCLVGSCSISPMSTHEACLHHVEINPSRRRQGYAYSLIILLLKKLSREGIHTVTLHVDGSNLSAFSLYKKAGFQLTETLSSYRY